MNIVIFPSNDWMFLLSTLIVFFTQLSVIYACVRKSRFYNIRHYNIVIRQNLYMVFLDFPLNWQFLPQVKRREEQRTTRRLCFFVFLCNIHFYDRFGISCIGGNVVDLKGRDKKEDRWYYFCIGIQYATYVFWCAIYLILCIPFE